MTKITYELPSPSALGDFFDTPEFRMKMGRLETAASIGGHAALGVVEGVPDRGLPPAIGITEIVMPSEEKAKTAHFTRITRLQNESDLSLVALFVAHRSRERAEQELLPPLTDVLRFAPQDSRPAELGPAVLLGKVTWSPRLSSLAIATIRFAHGRRPAQKWGELLSLSYLEADTPQKVRLLNGAGFETGHLVITRERTLSGGLEPGFMRE